MNAANPFKVPSCIQRANIQQRRQERIKRAVVGSVIAMSAGLVFLLVEGCMRERANAGHTGADSNTVVAEALPASEATVVKPAVIAEPKPVTLAPTTVVSTPTNTTQSPLSPTKTRSVYIVRSGDTLAHIAKLYNISIRSIKSTNGLTTDKLAVGTKLKLPEA